MSNPAWQSVHTAERYFVPVVQCHIVRFKLDTHQPAKLDHQDSIKRSLKLGSHMRQDSVLPNTWYLVVATCMGMNTNVLSTEKRLW